MTTKNNAPSSKTPKPSSKTPKPAAETAKAAKKASKPPADPAKHGGHGESASEEPDKQRSEPLSGADGPDKQRSEGTSASDGPDKQRGAADPVPAEPVVQSTEGCPFHAELAKHGGEGQKAPERPVKQGSSGASGAGGRAFSIEERPDGIAIVRLDVPGDSVNTLHARFAEEFGVVCGELEAAVDRGTVRGVVFTSAKKDNFLAGADLNMLKGAKTPAEASQLSQRGQEAMQRLEELGRRVPVVAAIHGAALGGGLELALACTARVCSDDPKTVLGLPEVQLGVIPGAGGTQRLPRLIGIEGALDLILTGKQLKAPRALRAGLCDEVVPKSILLEVAVGKARKLADERAAPPEASPIQSALRSLGKSLNARGIKKLLLEDNPLGRKILWGKARQALVRKTRGNYPAPESALDVVRTGVEEGIAAGYAAEAQAFGGLVVSPQAHQLIGIFQATTALKKDRGSDDVAAVPRPLTKIGMLGAGLMGAGIAYVTTAQAGLSVRLKDKDDAAVGRGLKYVREIFDERVKKKSLTAREAAAQLARVTPTLNNEGFSDVEVVIEAVFEDLGLKQRVLRDVETSGRPDVIFASNTSSLPISEIAQASAHPETVIGMHYFSPVHKMPLLEIIVTDKTAPWVTATCVELGKRQGKTVIVVRDGVGFYTSRILGPYMNEAAYLLAAGVPVERIDEALLDFGFPVGPLTLLDEVGIDVAEKVGHIVHKAFGDRLTPPPGIESLVRNGRHGKKNGRGFYRYDLQKQKGRRPVDTTIYAELGLPAPAAHDPGPVPTEDIQLRCALQMVNEAALCLQEGILRSPRDGDIGAIFGLGFPPFLGGPFRYADSLGIGEVVRRLQEYQAQHGSRFTPAELLVEMAKKNKKFY